MSSRIIYLAILAFFILSVFGDDEILKPPKEDLVILPPIPVCQRCGQTQFKWFTSCTTTANKGVLIKPKFASFANCNAAPTCDTFYCPSPLVRRCVPLTYGTFGAIRNSKLPVAVSCVVPRTCVCKCEWPLFFREVSIEPVNPE